MALTLFFLIHNQKREGYAQLSPWAIGSKKVLILRIFEMICWSSNAKVAANI